MTKLSVQSPEPTALRAATHLLSDYLGSGLVYTKWNVCGIQTPHRSGKKETALYATRQSNTQNAIQYSKFNPKLKMQHNLI